MAKILRCGELFPGCSIEARGETEEEGVHAGQVVPGAGGGEGGGRKRRRAEGGRP